MITEFLSIDFYDLLKPSIAGVACLIKCYVGKPLL